MFRKKAEKKIYDREKHLPVLRCSICTGEQVAGFRELATGRFHEVMLIRDDRDLRQFLDAYGLTEITKEY